MSKRCATCLFWSGNDTLYSATCDHVYGGSGKVPFSHVCGMYVANGKQVMARVAAEEIMNNPAIAPTAVVVCAYCQSVDITAHPSGVRVCNVCLSYQP